MEKKADKIYSENLNREINVNVYGHYGLSILLFPALNNKSTEFEENGGLVALDHLIKIGKSKIFCIDGIDYDLWLCDQSDHKEKSKLHYNFNKFIEDELVPYIFNQCGGPVPILTAGASIGAYHAVNTFFRRPDLFYGTIGLSGFYDITKLVDDYFDDNCYYNSPVHYLPNLNDSYWMSYLYSRRHIYLYSGSGNGENPYNSEALSTILNDKGIRNHLEIKDGNNHHDFGSWIEMFKFFIENKL